MEHASACKYQWDWILDTRTGTSVASENQVNIRPKMVLCNYLRRRTRTSLGFSQGLELSCCLTISATKNERQDIQEKKSFSNLIGLSLGLQISSPGRFVRLRRMKQIEEFRDLKMLAATAFRYTIRQRRPVKIGVTAQMLASEKHYPRNEIRVWGSIGIDCATACTE